MLLPMRVRAVRVVVLCLALGACLRLGALPQEVREPARLLVARAFGPTPMLADLRELCDTIGGRPAGSEANRRAVEWAAARFREAGADSVKLEAFTIASRWQAGKAEAEAISPVQFSIRVAAAPPTGGTPAAKPIEAALVDLGDGTAADFERLGARTRGAIGLVHSREMKTGADLFEEYNRNGPLVEGAKKAGLAALLLQSTRPRGLLYRHPMSVGAGILPLPAALVAREQASRLARLAEKGDVRLRLTLANQIGGAYESHNVVAEIRGREKPEEIVLIGAHLDSWDLGTGAEDNGVNCAMLIDLARGFKQLGLAPRRTIRFVLFNAEEFGMLGSEAYVKQHAAELDRVVTMITFDVGSGRTTGFYLNGRHEMAGPLDRALHAVSGLQADSHSMEALDGTDNFDFLLAGVPTLVASQEWTPYLPNYHAESDVYDVVDEREAKANAAIAAAVVWGLAEASERPAPRQNREQVENLIRETHLDDQMKMFGQWDAWVSGKRGVYQ